MSNKRRETFQSPYLKKGGVHEKSRKQKRKKVKQKLKKQQEEF